MAKNTLMVMSLLIGMDKCRTYIAYTLY